METEIARMKGKPSHVAMKVREYNPLYDLPGIVQIEELTEGWPERTFISFESQKTSLVRVAINLDTSAAIAHIGHVTVTVDSKKKNIVVRRIAVHPDFHRKGVGGCLFADIQKIARRRGAMVLVPVPETDLSTQLWLRHVGAICFRWDDTEYRSDDVLTYWFRA